MRPSDLTASFERDGFVLVPGVLEPQRCAEMVEAIWAEMPQHFDRDRPASWTGRIQDCCNNLPVYQRNGLLRYKDKHGFREHPVFARHVHENSELRRTVEAVTGRSIGRVHVRGLHPVLPMPRWITINEATGNRLSPDVNRRGLHQLKVPRPPILPLMGHLDAHSVDLLMMLYLDDVGPGGGGLHVWPGSHRLLEPCFESLHDFIPTPAYRRTAKFLQRFRPVHVDGRRGDIVLFHNRLLHSNSVNTSRRVRQAVLVDLFSADRKERDEAWKSDPTAEEARRRLARTRDVADGPEAGVVEARLTYDGVRHFWSQHQRLRGWVAAIGKDPKGKARRQLSSKIRSRREGDCWVVVSQDRDHRRSRKLDAYGEDHLGRFSVAVNGGACLASLSGSLVESVEWAEGENSIRVRGQFAARHYLRVLRTRNPIERSDLLFTVGIPAKPGVEEYNFTVPR